MYLFDDLAHKVCSSVNEMQLVFLFDGIVHAFEYFVQSFAVNDLEDIIFFLE